jgi:hypothetical protein
LLFSVYNVGVWLMCISRYHGVMCDDDDDDDDDDVITL